MLKVSFLEYHLNIKMLLCMALIWSAKKLNVPATWNLCIQVHLLYIYYWIDIYLKGVILFSCYHGERENSEN